MKTVSFLLLLFIFIDSQAQTYLVTGNVTDANNHAVNTSGIIVKKKSTIYNGVVNNDGIFVIKSLPAGFYSITITTYGYEGHSDSFRISNADINLGQIKLLPVAHMLNEVSVVEKVLAMVQKDDTLEYNSGAYKVNQDADAADLVKKMPGIELNNKQVTAQGENVIKVLVDGKPFFGNDPYSSLKNMPADMIAKVQVYNEKSEQERFTGFSEGSTSKTVNIITKPGRRNGVFGTMYAGYGSDNSRDDKYGVGATLTKFKEDRRITFTGQSNNINAQNFSTENISATGGAGIAKTNAAGINYSDKWGEKLDVSGSYAMSIIDNSATREFQKIYLLAVDSGQVYDEFNPSESNSQGHRLSARINYTIDSSNSLLWVPNVSVNKNDAYTVRNGDTREAQMPVNLVADTSISKGMSYNWGSNLLYRHRFHKKGRTFSLSINTGNTSNDGTTLHTAQSVYYASPALNNRLNQQTLQQQQTWTLTGNATYTEPVRKNGSLKLEYNGGYTPSHSERNTSNYSDATNAYSIADTQYSNSFYSNNTTHKAGASYLVHATSAEFSAGLNYQLTQLRNDQQYPMKYALNQDFQNLLPVVTLRYKFSKTRNLQCNYNTSTQAPSVSQLQNVVNNNDPLHLYTGNQSLRQPYRHSLAIRYSATTKTAKNNFSVSLSGGYTQHYITSNSIIAASDSIIGQGIILARGSQLTVPVNTDGYSTLHTNITYGLPLSFMKCQLNININAGLANIPGMINNEVNTRQNRNGGAGISLSSNISDRIDFIVSSNTTIVSNANSINNQLTTTYVNENAAASVNLLLWKGIVFNTAVSYQLNTGLSASYNQNYALWNMSIGKKVFKKQQGDIRLSAFDLLNENNSIQYTVTDAYIQNTRSTILQRYFLLVFTYKLREFKKQQL